MKNNTYKNISIVFYLLSFFILLFLAYFKFVSTFQFSIEFRLLFILIACILMYISGFLLVNKLGYSKKILKFNLIIYFLIYTVTIFTLTLFDEFYGRRGISLVNWNKEILNQYIKYSFNIVPFRTINLFIKGYINNLVSFHNFSINIIGNFVAFMPYGAFIPMIFKKIDKYYKFLIIMIVIVFVIEIMQFLTLSGSCDIDDLLLNVLGASIIYLMIKIKWINKLIHKIFLFE